MKELERAVEWLRPFVDSEAWDFCVLWKFGDDPSRFIEWFSCCCSGAGGGYDCVKVQEGSGEKQKISFCRDAHMKHVVSTKACEALAKCPSFMDLYSGIHGEVVIANQPKWISLVNSSDPNPSNQSISTQVLIPVFGGLVELFAAKHIPKDENFVELVVAQCNPSIKQGVLPAGTYANESSSGSIPSIEHPSFDSSYGYTYIAQNVPLKQSIGRTNSYSKRTKFENHMFEEEIGSVLVTDLNVVVKDNKRDRQSSGRAKNLITERNRRNKLNDVLFALRALVPKISKMDRAAILGDAAEYIKELLQEVDKLQNEVKENEEEDCRKDNAEMKSSKLDAVHEGTSTIHLPPTEHDKNSPGCGEKEKTKVQLEVSQIDKRDFLIKLLWEHKRGGFVRLMEAINCLELQVIDANVTTFNGKVLNILRVQANTNNIQLKKLRETLIELTG